jgi:hypothetical protein
MNVSGMKRLITAVAIMLAMRGLHACKSSSQKDKVVTDFSE